MDIALGLILVIAAGGLTVILSLKKVRQRFPPVFRRIAAFQRLRRAVGLSVEDGSRIHVGLGNASLVDPVNPSALIGLSALHRIGQLSSTSDQPPIASSGDGAFSLMSKDVLHTTAAETNTRDLYNPDHGQLTGINPFSYAVGAMNLVDDPVIKTHILVGNFGPEAGLLTSAIENANGFLLAGSVSMTSQAIFFAATPDALIGEELFALPAYLAYSPVHSASLRVEDILRYIIGGVMVIGSVLKVIGVL